MIVILYVCDIEAIIKTYVVIVGVKNTYIAIPTVENPSWYTSLDITLNTSWDIIDDGNCYCNYNCSYNYSNDWQTNPNNRVYSDIPSLIWKIGIAMACDFHDSYYFMFQHIGKKEQKTFEFDNISDIVSKTSKLANGSLIYLSSKQIDTFANDVLPTIIDNKIYFTLIITTSVDYVIPLSYHQRTSYNQSFFNVLNNEYLLYIFCENFDGSTWQWQKYNDPMINTIYPVPDGLDFHTPMQHALSNLTWDVKYRDLLLPSQFEHQIQLILTNISSRSQSMSLRHFSVFVDYYLNYGVYTKKSCGNNDTTKPTMKKKMAASLNRYNILDLYKYNIHYKKHIRGYLYCQIIQNDDYQKIFSLDNVQRTQVDGLMERSKYIFSLSLFGNGLDCHRTYESILMDNIVIVLSSPLDILYKLHDMPIVIINGISEINSTMLHYWYQKYKNKTYLYCKHTRDMLTTKYWIDYMRQMTSKKLDYITSSKV